MTPDEYLEAEAIYEKEVPKQNPNKIDYNQLMAELTGKQIIMPKGLEDRMKDAKEQGLYNKIAALEKRVTELESRPLQILQPLMPSPLNPHLPNYPWITYKQELI